MAVLIGIILGLGATFGGFMAMGGHPEVVWQPFEYLIIGGIAFSTFIIANPISVIKDTGAGIAQAAMGVAPKRKDFLALLSLLYALMRDMRQKPRNEIEAVIDDPASSALFGHFPTILKDKELTQYVCDYARLILIGNAKSHEIEALMEQEISTIKKHKTKPAGAISTVAEALPALGICAAVLGIVKAMGAIDQSPEILGHYIGSALIGTFVGIYSSYAILTPLSAKVKSTREKQCQPFIIVKASLIAFMNGALPPIALEHGRKTISAGERPSIDEVESESIQAAPSSSGAAMQQAA